MQKLMAIVLVLTLAAKAETSEQSSWQFVTNAQWPGDSTSYVFQVDQASTKKRARRSAIGCEWLASPINGREKRSSRFLRAMYWTKTTKGRLGKVLPLSTPRQRLKTTHLHI
jgi:hypothetical protein